jgi:hypothetical protein
MVQPKTKPVKRGESNEEFLTAREPERRRHLAQVEARIALLGGALTLVEQLALYWVAEGRKGDEPSSAKEAYELLIKHGYTLEQHEDAAVPSGRKRGGAVKTGPRWSVRGYQIRDDIGLGRHIATWQTCEADGRLLAAAPELLDMLVQACDAVDGGVAPRTDEIRARLTALRLR